MAAAAVAGEGGIGLPLGRVARGAVLLSVRGGVLSRTRVGGEGGVLGVDAGHCERERGERYARAQAWSKGWDVRAARREKSRMRLDRKAARQKKESGNGPVVGARQSAAGSGRRH